MQNLLFFFQLLSTFFQASCTAESHGIGKVDIRLEKLNDGYTVEWIISSNSARFNVTVKTLGYIGFGISPSGGMDSSDIVIGGVHGNGTPYFSDRHGIGNMPQIDTIQNWVMHSSSQNGSHTTLSFSRLLNTCDNQDVVIDRGTTNFIWCFGASDEIEYHGNNRGTFEVNILDPSMPQFDSSQFKLWRMTLIREMPAKKTQYWCAVKKSPPVLHKHHIVGFRPVLETPEALKHTHHVLVHKCAPPDGHSAFETFDRFVNKSGGECYTRKDPNLPMEYCQHYLFVWGHGGKEVIYPDHVGYPIGVNGEHNYYILEVHYDNPKEEAGIKFETGLEFFYTNQTRKYDAGTITAGHETEWSIMIPPKSTNFTIVGHCSPKCTSHIPPTGIKVFNVLLHAHLSGRKMKVRHFRGNMELPWLALDNNYNFDFQQDRPLIEERTILPGDHITYECTYDNRWANGTILGGLTAADEMCMAFLWYYPDIGLEVCTSEFPRSKLISILRLKSNESGWDPIISAPAEMAGKSFSEVLNSLQWTDANRSHIQQHLLFGDHADVCVRPGFSKMQAKQERAVVTYPEKITIYKPPEHCSTEEPSASSSNKIEDIAVFSLAVFVLLYLLY